MNNTIFSHRPAAGVSVGARNVDNQLVIAFALVNDGTSRNGFMHEDRADTFCRKTARSIVEGRINNALEGGTPGNMVVVFSTEMTAQQFMSAFRPTFKPDHDESDSFLADIMDFGGVEVRYRPEAREIVRRVIELANDVVATGVVA